MCPDCEDSTKICVICDKPITRCKCEDGGCSFTCASCHKKNVTVNGRNVLITSDKVSHTDLVWWAYGVIPRPSAYVVTFKAKNGLSGSLLSNRMLKVEDGMIFNVMTTGDA